MTSTSTASSDNFTSDTSAASPVASTTTISVTGSSFVTTISLTRIEITQLVECAAKTVNMCKAVYAGEAPDAQLVARNKFIKLQAQEAKTMCIGWTQTGQSERTLHDLVVKCQTLSRDLDDEIQHITQHQQAGSLRSTFRVMTKMAWRQKRLDRLQKSIEAWEKILERQLLQSL